MSQRTTAPAVSPVRRVHRFVWVGVALLIVTFIGASKSISPSGERPGADKPISDGPRPGGFGHWDLDDGVAHPYPLQPGRVVEVFKRDGDEVNANDPLFRMDDQLAKNSWESAKNAVLKAQLDLERARDGATMHTGKIKVQKAVIAAKKVKVETLRYQADEANRMFKSENLSQEKANAASALVKAAEEEVKVEEATLELLETTKEPQLQIQLAERAVAEAQNTEQRAKIAVDECIVRAPKKGQILRSSVRVGESLGPNPLVPAMEYASEGRRIVRAEIDQEFGRRVFVGQTAMVEDDTRSGPVWTGKVTRVSDWQAKQRSQMYEPLRFNDVRTLEVIIELDGSAPLKIGQRLRVMLE